MLATMLSAADTAAIQGLVQPWTTACLDRDWDAALAMCTDDVVFMPPDEPTVQGSAVRDWLERYPIMKQFEWDFDQIEGQGDLAFGRGWFHVVLEVPEGTTTMDGKFVDVFERGTDGKWRIAVLMFSSNAPAKTA